MLLFCRLRSSQMVSGNGAPCHQHSAMHAFYILLLSRICFPNSRKASLLSHSWGKGICSFQWMKKWIKLWDVEFGKNFFSVAKNKKVFAKFSFTISIVNKWFLNCFYHFLEQKEKGLTWNYSAQKSIIPLYILFLYFPEGKTVDNVNTFEFSS